MCTDIESTKHSSKGINPELSRAVCREKFKSCRLLDKLKVHCNCRRYLFKSTNRLPFQSMIHYLKTMICPILFVMGFWTLAIAIDELTTRTPINTCVQPTLTLRKILLHTGYYGAGQLQGQIAQATCAKKCENEMASYHFARIQAHSSADICHAGENVCSCLSEAVHIPTAAAEGTSKTKPGNDNTAGTSFVGFLPYGIPYWDRPYWASHVTDSNSMTNPNSIRIGMLGGANLRNSNKANYMQLQPQLQSIQCHCSIQVQYLKMRIQRINLELQLDGAEGICGFSTIVKRHQINGWQSLDSMSRLPIFPCNGHIEDQRSCSGVMPTQCQLYPSAINLEIPTAFS